MAQTYTINGVAYSFPDVDDSDWGQNVTDWAGAVSSFLLQRTGGTFTLSAEVDFGSSYGLLVKDLGSKTANPASAGFLQLAKTDVIAWRNNANDGDLNLEKGTDDLLQFNSIDLVNLSATQTLTNKTLTAPVISTISNSGTVTLPTGAETLVGRATTDTLTNKTIDQDNNTISNIIVSCIKSDALDTNLTSVSASDDTLASAKAIKTYVDTQVGGSSLEFTGDTTTGTPTVDLDAQALVITGGTGLASTASAQTLTMSIDATVATLTGSQTLTNKTLTTPIISSISNTGTLTLPTSTDTLVGRATTDTLTNKTLTTPIISSISNTGTLTLPTSTDTLVGRATTDTLTNKTLTTPIISSISNTGTITLPTSTDTLVGRATTDTLTNKTLTTPVIASLQQASGTNTLTMPAATDTLVGKATTDTLTNKTLTGANIGTGKVTDYAIFDHQGSDPGATPDSNDVFLYAKENKVYTKDSTGAVTELGAGGGVGSIDTLFTLQAKTADAATSGSGNDAVFLGGGTLSNATVTLDTTAADLIGADKVFKYNATGDSIRNYWYHEQSIYPGYAGKNMVLQLQYYTRNGADGESFRFVARDATMPILSVTADGTNTITGTIDATVTTAPVVGDKIIFKDSSNNIYYRYITVIVKNSGSDGKTSGDNMTYTYSGSDVTATGKVVTGIMTDELDYLPANDITGNEAKIYKKQMLFPDNCTTFQFGFHCLDSDTDIELFYDDIALSANQFLQTSSQGQPEEYRARILDHAGTKSNRMIVHATSGVVTKNSIDKLGTVNNDTTNGWYFQANERCRINISVSLADSNSSGGFGIMKFNVPPSSLGDNAYDNAQWDGYRISGGQDTNGSGYQGNVSAECVMEKGEYIQVVTDWGNDDTQSSSKSVLNICVTPLVNDVVLLNSGVNDELFTDWIDVGAMTILGTSSNPTKPSTLNADKVRWRRIGDSMEIRYEYYASSLTGASDGSGDYLFQIPSGYTIDQSKVRNYTTDEGYGFYKVEGATLLGSFLVVNHASSESMQGEAIAYDSTGFRLMGHLVNHTNLTRLGLVGSGNGWGTTKWNSIIINVKVPIAGWTSTFNPVLSMPLVDTGAENEQVWVHGWSGAATYSVYSTNFTSTLDKLATLTNASGSGFYITAKQDIIVNASFTQRANNIASYNAIIKGPASVWDHTVEMGDNRYDGYIAAAQDNEAGYGGNTSTEIAVKAGEILGFLRSVNGSYPPYSDDHTGASVIACRKDHSNNNLAHIIKPAVMTFAREVANGGYGGTITSGTWNPIEINIFGGETWFATKGTGSLGVGGDNVSINLEPGTYEIQAQVNPYGIDSGILKLYDQTNSQDVARSINSYSNQAYNGGQATTINHTWTVTSTTEYRLFLRCSNTKTDYGLGVNFSLSGYTEKYLTGYIRKLK